tara:strand:+ start:2627 stop:2809 length:183 start_codon:yes stop_codon:yes gene_type:complete
MDFLNKYLKDTDSVCRNCRVRRTYEYSGNTPLCFTCLKEVKDKLKAYELKNSIKTWKKQN